MKRNKSYVFWTPSELADALIYGEKKEYNFTFDTKESLEYSDPCGWYGIKLISMFDSIYPNMLAIGYWGGEDSKFYSLESTNDKNEYREKIVSAITEYFDENESKISCVEFSKSS